MEIRISIFTVLAFVALIIACLCTKVFYTWMLYLSLTATSLFAIKFRVWSIGANLVNFVTFYIIFYYPVVFTYIIDLSENTLFYMGLCSGLCVFALYFLIYWHLAKEGNELALKNIEWEVNDISRASEFNFPQPVDWERTKKDMEYLSLALHYGLEGGFVSKILLFPDKLSFISTCGLFA